MGGDEQSQSGGADERGGHLLTLRVRSVEDAVVARQRAKRIARLLGFERKARTAIAAATLEVLRGVRMQGASSCTVAFRLETAAVSQTLWVVVHADGAELAANALQHLGALFDNYSIENAEHSACVQLGKRLRRGPISTEQLGRAMEELERFKPPSPLEELRFQNQELLGALDALQQSEVREARRASDWQATFDAIPDAIGLLDPAGVVRQANRALATMLDVKRTELEGALWKELDPFTGTEPPSPIPELLHRARSTSRRAMLTVRQGHRWYRFQVDPLHEDPEVHGFVLLIAEVTEERQAADRLQKINEALRSYAHSISHDIKGPLAGAITANQVLQQLLASPLTPDNAANIRELGGLVAGGINRTVALINDVLALAETGAGPGGSTDVRAVVERVIDDRKQLIAERGVTLEVDDTLGQLIAAPAHLYQIFANLLDNALRHLSAADPRIQIRRLASPEPGLHRFLFRDNGPGIAEELRDRAFEAFQHGADGGTGIGLATVKRVLATYDGIIHSYNDGGACFEFELADAILERPPALESC